MDRLYNNFFMKILPCHGLEQTFQGVFDPGSRFDDKFSPVQFQINDRTLFHPRLPRKRHWNAKSKAISPLLYLNLHRLRLLSSDGMECIYKDYTSLFTEIQTHKGNPFLRRPAAGSVSVFASQLRRNLCKLIKSGFEVVGDFFGKDVRRREGFGVRQGLVFNPEEVEAQFVAFQ